MSQSPIEQLIAAIHLREKCNKISRERGVARKRHELEEEEFEALLQQDDADPTAVEAKRLRVISTYEQYIDCCLALRTQSIEAESKIDQMIKDANK